MCAVLARLGASSASSVVKDDRNAQPAEPVGKRSRSAAANRLDHAIARTTTARDMYACIAHVELALAFRLPNIGSELVDKHRSDCTEFLSTTRSVFGVGAMETSGAVACTAHRRIGSLACTFRRRLLSYAVSLIGGCVCSTATRRCES